MGYKEDRKQKNVCDKERRSDSPMADSGWRKMMHRSRKRPQNQYLSILEDGHKRIF